MGHFLGDILRITSFSLHYSSPTSASYSKMKTFVLAIFVASAAIGVICVDYSCSPQIMDFVDAMGGCSSECAGGVSDDCIECVMKGMKFGTDIEAFVLAEEHIVGDTNSLDCLDSVKLTDNPTTEEEFKDFIAPLKGKNLTEVFAVEADKDLLYELFEAARTCIAEGGCFDQD